MTGQPDEGMKGAAYMTTGSTQKGYPCPKDGATLALLSSEQGVSLGAWCPTCHTVWREAGEVSLRDLDELPSVEDGSR